MICTLEGPDRSGKTTAFLGLVHAGLLGPEITPIMLPAMSVSFYDHICELESFMEAFWSCIYDPTKTYFCDRSLFVSGQVYAKLYGRRALDMTRWRGRIHVIYFDCPLQVLLTRCNRPDDKFEAKNYEQVMAFYEAELTLWPNVTRLKSDDNPTTVIQNVYQLLRKLSTKAYGL